MSKNKFKIKYAKEVREIQKGIDDFEQGKSRLASEALAELAEKYGIDLQKDLSDSEIIGESINE